MNTNRNLCGLLSTLLLLLTAVPSFAASQNAVVYGTVYDAAGNPKGGVTVKIVDPDMGFSRTTTSASDGTFSFAEVPPSDEYRVIAMVEDRIIDFRGGVSVNVGDEMVVLPPLREQSVVATGKVEGMVVTAGVRNETVSTSISGVITGDQLRALPLYNRTFLALGLLTPNVRDVEAGSEIAGASYSISGNRTTSNNFLLDGSDNVASGSNQAIPFQVNDSIQEFRVVSSTAPAEYGRNSGGVVNVVTRRAGNGFHGSLHGYFANDALNGESPLSIYSGTTFDRAAALAGSPNIGTFVRYNGYVTLAEALGFCTDQIDPTGAVGSVACVTGGRGENTRFDPAAILAQLDGRTRPFDSKQFGGSAGGALVKDRWFGFASYEGTRINNPNPIFERVPSAFDRTYDPYNTGTFLFAPTSPDYVLAQEVLDLFPQPNVVGVPGVLEFFRGEAPNHTYVHNLLLRTDIRKSEFSSWSLRYVIQNLNQLHDATLPPQPNYPGNGAFRDALNQNLSGSYSHAFSSSLINEVRAGFNRFDVRETPQDAGFDATTLGAPGFNFPNASLPTILLHGLDTQSSGAIPGANGAFVGWSEAGPGVLPPLLDHKFPFARLGAPLTVPNRRLDTTLFFSDNLAGSFRKHNWKAGIEVRYLFNDTGQGGFSRGLLYSSNIGEFTSDSQSCNQRCLQLFGAPDSFQRPSFDFFQAQTEPYAGHFRSWALGGFVQDSWRLHPRWTVNLGVRYEYFSVPREDRNQIWNFDPQANGLVQAGTTKVMDPFGDPCGLLFVRPHIPFAAESPIGPPGPWTCQTDGAFSLGRSDRNNFAPRLGVAWDVFGDGKTVVRGGFGFYFDHQPPAIFAPLLYNRPTGIANANAMYGQISNMSPIFFPVFNPCQRPLAPPTLARSLSCPLGNSILNPTRQEAFAAPLSLAAQPFAIYARDVAHSSTPYTRQINSTVQQAISDRLALEVGYVGTEGELLPVVFNSNYQNEFTIFEFNSLPRVPNQTAGNLVLFPVFTMTNQGSSSYHSLLLRVRAEDWHGLRVHAAYSLSNSEDNASSPFYPILPITLNNLALGYQTIVNRYPAVQCLTGTATTSCFPTLAFPGIEFSTPAVTTTGADPVLVSRYQIPQDPFNFLRDDLGRSDFHTRHRLVVDYTWEVPSLNKWLGLPKWLDQWQVSGIFVAQSGQPFTIFAGPILGEVTQRINLTGPINVGDDPNGAIKLTNFSFLTQPLFTCAVTANALPGAVSPLQPALGTACTGDSQRNAFTGPNYINLDLGVQKGFALGEGRALTFRAELYNLTGRRNFYNPISVTTTGGNVLNEYFGKIKSAHDSRQIQFAVRFTW